MADFPLLIVGARNPAGTITVTAPFDWAELATVETAGSEHAEQALATAAACFKNRAGWLPLHQRVEILDRVAEIMTQRYDELALGAAAEGGKPLIDSRVEVTRAIDGIRLCTEVIRAEAGDVVPMGGTAASAHRVAFTQREPIGVVVAVSAFNHPLNLIVHQVAAGIAAGCPVVVKPAEDTPLSCLRFVQILHEAGLPQEWAQVVIASERAVSEQLVTDKRLGFFSFIGSAGVGWMLRSKLAPGVRCALEHGGVAPLIVASDANLELAAPAITKGGFYHAGQVCVSVQRVFADQVLAEELAADVAERASNLRVGDPTLEDTDVGPLIRHAETERVHS
ncbi:MAG: aldehyde dehydrogenase family protein, partial [Gammaproteobacteria bacterium]